MQPGFKLSVRVEPVFRNMSLAQSMEKVAEAGYQGFEFGNGRAQDPAAITKLKNSLRLECACLVGNRAVNPKGMTLVDLADRVAAFETRVSVISWQWNMCLRKTP